MSLITIMLLKNLIKFSNENHDKIDVRGLSINSKKIKKGFIFFAIKGNHSNGENFINEAINNGAAVIVCSTKCKFKSNRVVIIKTNKIRNLLSEIASKFYSLKPKNIIAVTGTNGKTSVADFFYQILCYNKIAVASIGTLGIKYKKKNIKTNLTSPDTITLHKNLEKIKINKIDNVIIECSSHGLSQNRLDHLKFKAGIFTNFSQDHLDYHKTMKSYLNSKLILFSKLLPKKSYIISDKSIKQYKILQKISKLKKIKLIDIKKKNPLIKNLPKSYDESFQKKNLMMSIFAARLCGLSNIKIKNALKKIKNVEGRLELIKKYSNNAKVFVDYAHTPDALNATIKSLKKIYHSNISLVFGCGGERDFKKRALMAKIANLNCEKIYVTDDNPRNEDPKKIRKEIIKYLKSSNYFDIGDRFKAIKKAILHSNPNEIILVAGKGHEKYQDYGKKIIKISDKEIIKKIKFKKKRINKDKIYSFNSKILRKIIKYKKDYKFNALKIDSREIKKDNLFLAIKGKNNDGNNFIGKALKNGASFIISSKNIKKYKKKIIKINNPISFLNKFATLKRNNSSAKILAVTGSAGKTSLKNMLHFLLEEFGNTYSSPRSFNNHYGVPISLANLNSQHEFGVFEVGMSKSGEINKLSKMIKPNLAVITNIAEAHIENFKNIKGIANAKSEIINNVQKNGMVILNRDDKFFNFLNKKVKLENKKVLTFGKSKKSDIRLLRLKRLGKENLVTVNAKSKIIKLRTKNVNIYNILASLTVLTHLNLDIKKIIRKLKNFEPSDGRGRVHKVKRYNKSFSLIDESYNANPFSVKNAISSFSSIKKNKFKKYLLLGDMLELGKKSEVYHMELSKLINKSDIDKVFIKGEKTLYTYKNLKKDKRGNILQYNQDIEPTLKNIITNNDYLMIKGSNATGLNTVSKTIIKGN